MIFENKTLITSRSVVDDITGEINVITFEEKTKRRSIKGGWNMTYAEGYDLLILQLTSRRETMVFLYIKDLFKKSQTEVNLSPTHISKLSGYDSKFISKTIKKLVGLDFIMQMPDKSYRMNPYIVIPFGGEAESLQAEWGSIRKSNGYIRRGKDVYDSYKESEYTSFKKYYEDLKYHRGSATRVYGRVLYNKNQKEIK